MAKAEGPSEDVYPLNLAPGQKDPLKPLALRHPHLFDRFNLAPATYMEEGDPEKAVEWIINKPTAIIATDEYLAAYLDHSHLGLILKEYVKRGGTLVLMGGPTWHDDYQALDRLYEEFDLSWRVGRHYFNEYDMVLNKRCPLSTSSKTMPSRYKTHGRVLEHVSLAEAVYLDIPTDISNPPYPSPPPYLSTPPVYQMSPDLLAPCGWPAPPGSSVPFHLQWDPTPNQCATMMAWRPYGKGHVGYVGECGFGNAKLGFRQEAMYEVVLNMCGV